MKVYTLRSYMCRISSTAPDQGERFLGLSGCVGLVVSRATEIVNNATGQRKRIALLALAIQHVSEVPRAGLSSTLGSWLLSWSSAEARGFRSGNECGDGDVDPEPRQGGPYPSRQRRLAEGWIDVQTDDGVILVNPAQVAYVRDVEEPAPVLDQAG